MDLAGVYPELSSGNARAIAVVMRARTLASSIGIRANLFGAASRSVADAGIASLGTLAVTIAAARTLSLEDFGILAVAMTSAVIVVGLARVSIIDPYVLRYSGRPPAMQKEAARRAMGATALLCLLVSTVLFSVSVYLLIAGHRYVLTFATMALILPFFVLQDSFRFLSYARGDSAGAVLSSGVWTTCTLIGVGVILSGYSWTLSISVILAFWGAGAAVAMTISALRMKLFPDLRASFGWIREVRTTGIRTVADFTLTQTTSLGGALLISALVGAASYGAIRLAQIPLALAQVTITGTISFVQPTMVSQVVGGSTNTARRLAFTAAAVNVMVVGGTWFFLLLVPHETMLQILGASWDSARELVGIIAIGLVASAIAASYGPYLRAIGRLGFEVAAKLIISPVTLVMIIVGCATYGVLGGAIAQTLATGLIAAALVAGAYNAAPPAGRTIS